MKTFAELDLIGPLQRAIDAAGYTEPTPIQQQSIPALLDGRDVLGCAQTGTGKTAAFALPVLQHLATDERPGGRRPIRALVLSPTRELAAQIGESFETYGKQLPFRSFVLFGGVGQRPQVDALRRGIDILVATPGRLLDLMGQGHVDLGHVTHFVLDEADRMLDMGFIHDIRRVVRELPKKRQNLLFSATMPRAIEELAGTFLDNPVRVAVTPPATTVERIDQSVHFIEKGDKPRLLHDLLERLDVEQAIVFTRTKHGANRLVKWLDQRDVVAAALHGNKSQGARERAIQGFRNGDIRLLVATDIASRGIDIEGVSHVFNYDLPNEPESYVHRIGRTGRAGRAGMAVSFCGEDETGYLRDIERTTRQRIEIDMENPWHSESAERLYASGRRPAVPAGVRARQEGAAAGGGRRRSGGGGGGGGRSSGPARQGGGRPNPSGNAGGGGGAGNPSQRRRRNRGGGRSNEGSSRR
ncbi:MAG: DEAD/DEAH box helicase [Deltaproteobacteria bacterium]|nr:MAG: DEAD/DEAH box helicase [Deltaproteobacteria bacterium]